MSITLVMLDAITLVMAAMKGFQMIAADASTPPLRLKQLVGEQGVSDWHAISQATVAWHAEMTGDGEGEWVHLDPQRAAREPGLSGTIVQGFLQVSHLVRLSGQALKGMHRIDPNHTRNYGFDRLRFVNVMPVGARFRAVARVADVLDREAGCAVIRLDVRLELESGLPTLVADWLFHVDAAASLGA